MKIGHLIFNPKRKEGVEGMVQERIDTLEICKEGHDIDDALEQVGCKTIKEKCERLVAYMGAVVHSMEHRKELEMDYDTLYAVTKDVFLMGHWRALND
ncbi:MAG: hypothetical protein FWE90_12450 [Defluviitaleaceae bacterium]|nr:hypothetical protein [Defluviitaleaceae bacterium]